MVTELVTFKMEHGFLEEIDRTVRVAGFQNRTEFIRQALREKVQDVKIGQVMLELGKLRGKAPRKTTDEERERIREKVFEEFEKRL
ncbi:MAG: ribbon-helix-helix domain-containing protein [Candidatus Woesearchaeota archaeon]